jgi:hypothetical protein
MTDKADKVTLTHPDAEKPISVGADEVDRYALSGWTAEDPKSTTK